ncbi:MAG: hypothetical protein JWN68_2601 [Nocardioides sp.]|jgi:hypothetical protein|uniref:hypothetical protein n=1 Tax=Nocardioides sp. TaxID=35761 RepID=UPI00263488D5|nr:hypothetical protein [Nocardioides sp.]MCW2834648.1 hypothetical protein [Nocardioides sp.]
MSRMGRMGDRRGAAVQAVGFVLAFAVVGAVAGVVWELLWDAPDGLVFEGKWYLEPAGPDYAFSGTGWYVVVALVAGSLTALALGWLWPRHELVSLAAMVVGSTLAGWVMFKVGHALGPQDPQLLAAGKEDLSTLPSELSVVGAGDDPRLHIFDSSAFVAFPVGAMTAAVFLFLAMSGRRAAQSSDDRPSTSDNPYAG